VVEQGRTGTLSGDVVGTYTGAAPSTSTDVVLGGTGDFAGWTGFGTGAQTSDVAEGPWDADIELHLAPPTG